MYFQKLTPQFSDLLSYSKPVSDNLHILSQDLFLESFVNLYAKDTKVTSHHCLWNLAEC